MRKDSNKSDSRDSVDLTIEGEVDRSVRPWRGPSSLPRNPGAGRPAGDSVEQIDVLIANDEDLTVRPWRRATAPAADSAAASSPAETPVEPNCSGDEQTQHRRVERNNGLIILTFGAAEAVTPEAIEEIGTTVLDPSEWERPIVLILNLKNVRCLTSAAQGKLISLKKRLGAVHGKLRLCSIHPDLLEVLRLTHLDQVFEIYEDESSAREHS